MSNKNLKIYRIQFITEIKEMQFKVKFPCQIKMIWKRSNQSSQTTLVPVQSGLANFNQTLSLYVNMYFDTNTNRFVQKKCMYSFLLLTEKGQKSAGNVTYDLADFFNKRIYEVDEQFALQKCPLPDTKVRMKIYYEESTETGYDSMSRISTSSQLDISTVSMDPHEEQLQSTQKTFSKEITEETKSKKSEQQSTSKQASQANTQKAKQQNQNYDLLNESDLGGNFVSSNKLESSQKIGQNIQVLNQITGKINDFVTRCSGNIRSQIDNLKQQNKNLSQQLGQSRAEVDRLRKEKQTEKSNAMSLSEEYANFKLNSQITIKSKQQSIESMSLELQQSKKLCLELEKNMEEKGSSQSSYLQKLKNNFEQRENKLKEKISTQNIEINQQKKHNAALQKQISSLKIAFQSLSNQFRQVNQKNMIYQQRQFRRERQLTQLRQKMEDVYENIVKSMGIILH